MRPIDADRALEIVRDQAIAHPNAYHLTNYATLILQEAPTLTDLSKCLAFNSTADGKPQTNADRIRAMSDEELAEFMAERYDREHTARILGELIGRGYAPDQTMRRALHEKVRLQWLDWLRQPVKEDEQ